MTINEENSILSTVQRKANEVTQLNEKIKVHEANVEGKKAIFYVTCCPAQFWTIEVFTSKNTMTTIRTGSGTISRYWYAIKQVVNRNQSDYTVKRLKRENMLAVKKSPIT